MKLFRSEPTETQHLWHFFECQRFDVILRRIIHPGPLEFHNHRRPFRSIILLGGYTDQRVCGQPIRRRFFNRLTEDDLHRVLELHRNPTWTLNFCGRHLDPDKFGFITRRGFISFRDYSKKVAER